jgi:hypothetical protein
MWFLFLCQSLICLAENDFGKGMGAKEWFLLGFSQDIGHSSAPILLPIEIWPFQACLSKAGERRDSYASVLRKQPTLKRLRCVELDGGDLIGHVVAGAEG